MYELLTAEDKAMIDRCIGYHTASLEHILRFWNEAKSGYLRKLFKDQLIISTPISYAESLEDIMNHLDKFVYQDNRCCRFINSFKEYLQTIEGDDDIPSWKIRQIIANLVSYEFLAKNRIPFDIKINDWKFTEGTKTIKIISKIAKAYKIGIKPDEDGITDLEYFRRRHSLALNTKKLSGNLCLSIHPLDYMTMSDNSEDWTSCMSWEEDGEYRMGTVEMMNSPCVVVAYLASENNSYPIGGYNWNSKKWRSLFIVDPNFIANVKSYPYQNDNLTKEVMKKLAELAGWAPQEPAKYSVYNKKDNTSSIDGKLVKLYFNTDKMYNDFGSTTSYLLINPEYGEPELIDTEYNYSGIAECMQCGGTDEISREDTLFCDDCEPIFRCDVCGDGYGDEDDLITLGNGIRVCQCCYEEETAIDTITEEDYLLSDLTPVYLYNEDMPAYRIFLYDTSKFLTPKYTTLKELRFDSEKWENYVNISDLTQDGLDLFGYV